MRQTKKLLEELKSKHRGIKSMILSLVEKCESPNVSKEKIKSEIFKIYMEVK